MQPPSGGRTIWARILFPFIAEKQKCQKSRRKSTGQYPWRLATGEVTPSSAGMNELTLSMNWNRYILKWLCWFQFCHGLQRGSNIVIYLHVYWYLYKCNFNREVPVWERHIFIRQTHVFRIVLNSCPCKTDRVSFNDAVYVHCNDRENRCMPWIICYVADCKSEYPGYRCHSRMI